METLDRKHDETPEEFARRRELARALAKLVIEEEVLLDNRKLNQRVCSAPR